MFYSEDLRDPWEELVMRDRLMWGDGNPGLPEVIVF